MEQKPGFALFLKRSLLIRPELVALTKQTCSTTPLFNSHTVLHAIVVQI